MAFKKIKGMGVKKKSIYVAEQILEAISKGRYKVGDRLPPERVIAEEMGVSRPPVREALSALQIVGIVESVTGDGTYVRSSGESALIRSRALSVLERSESPFEAYRARRAFEVSIVEIAVDEATPEDLAAIEEILQRMDEAVETRDFEGYFEANRDFHLAIAQATNNSLIEQVVRYLLDIMDQQLWKEALQKHFSKYEHIKEYKQKHHRIFRAIKEKEKKRAMEEMRNHFDKTVEEVKRYL